MATSKHSDEILRPMGPKVRNTYKQFKAIHNGKTYYMAPKDSEDVIGY